MNTQQVLNKVNLDTVTSEQIGKCFLVIGPDGNRFYKVESEQDSETEYTVSYKNGRFFCTCHAGKEGFVHCYKVGVCKHVIWSLAAAREERTAMSEQVKAHSLIINGVEQSQEVVNALMNRPATKVFSHEIAQADALSRQRAFSLYR